MPMPRKTRQELFNLSYIHVVRQGRPARKPVDPETGEGGCYYMAPDGCRCAIGGPLFDPKTGVPHLYKSSMEGQVPDPRYTGTPTPLFDALVEFGVDPEDFLFLREIQAAHDQSTGGGLIHTFVESFKSYMAQTAKNYELTIPEVTNL